MGITSDKTLNELLVKLLALGWGYTRNKHLKLVPPFGSGCVCTSFTPSDRRAVLNIRRDIRNLYRKNGIKPPEFL